MPVTILIIEDDDLLRSSLEDRLVLEGFGVQTAVNGQAGVQAAQQAPPDLILCDIMMPGLDGYGVLRALQADPRTAAIPFVFLTARATPTHVRVGMGVGADDYLCKPVTKEALLVAIKVRLWKHEQQRAQLADAALLAQLDAVRKLPQELLTPLTGLLSFGQLLKTATTATLVADAQALGPVLNQTAERVQRTARRLLLAELEAANGQPPAQVQLRGTNPLPATAWVSALAKHLAQRYSRQDDLSLDLAEVEVAMTTLHFGELVSQLVDNAFKFSARGRRVQIQLALQPDHWCALTVRDQGPGLTPEELRSTGTSGELGLALVRQLVTLYGGTFALENEFDGGARACVRLPGARPGAQTANPLAAELRQRVALALNDLADAANPPASAASPVHPGLAQAAAVPSAA
jgi:DNA-binding response OmpR family regulator